LSLLGFVDLLTKDSKPVIFLIRTAKHYIKYSKCTLCLDSDLDTIAN
jgi:hypothetical protein